MRAFAEDLSLLLSETGHEKESKKLRKDNNYRSDVMFEEVVKAISDCKGDEEIESYYENMLKWLEG